MEDWKGREKRMGKRYIDADFVRSAKVPYDEELSEYERGWNDACDAIAADAPTADVRENVHARWKKTDAYPHRVYCLNCYATLVPNEEWIEKYQISTNFCPNCGAQMDERREE